MFSSYSGEVLEGTLPACKPFFQLTAFEEQLSNSGPLLGYAVQAASNNAETPQLLPASGRGRVIGKFNFGVSTEGEVGGLGVPQMGEAARLLFQPGS